MAGTAAIKRLNDTGVGKMRLIKNFTLYELVCAELESEATTLRTELLQLTSDQD